MVNGKICLTISTHSENKHLCGVNQPVNIVLSHRYLMKHTQVKFCIDLWCIIVNSAPGSRFNFSQNIFLLSMIAFYFLCCQVSCKNQLSNSC